MKKILIPITLTTLAPAISLVGCGGETPPEPPAVTTYTVTFELGEGSIEGLTGNTMTVNENTTYGMLPSPKLNGFSFNGWTVNGNDVKLTDVITSDVTVTAKWSEIEDDRFDVILESDGMLDISVDKGTTGASFWTFISLHDGYSANDWIIPDNTIYYDVTVDGKPFYDFQIKKIDVEDEFKYDIMFYAFDLNAHENLTIKVKPYFKYLTFTYPEGATGDINITLDVTGTVDLEYIYFTYNLDDGWLPWLVGESKVLNSSQKQIYIWNPNNYFTRTIDNNYLHFSCSDTTNKGFYCSGNIMSLVNFSSLSLACFRFLFKNSPILSAPTLPATTLATACYAGMFEECTKLTKVILPAENIANSSYDDLFVSCSNLQKIKVGFGTKDSREWDVNTSRWMDHTSDNGIFIWKGSSEGPEERDKTTVLEGWTIQTWG